MKTSLIISGIFLFLLSSCTKEEQFTNIYEAQKIVMSVEDFKFENQSRTTLTPTDDGATFTWAENDTIGIFPETGNQIAFPMTSGAGTNTATFTGGGWALKTSTPYMAYYPMQGKFYLDKANIRVNYTGQTQAENASTAHLGKYDYMVASATTPEKGAVNFQFKHLGALVRLKVTMRETSTINRITLQTDNYDFIGLGYIDLTETTPKINTKDNNQKSNSFDINLKNITVEENEDLIVYFLLAPVDLTDKTLKAIVHKENGYFQEITLEGKNFEAGKPYELVATMMTEEEKPLVVDIKEAGTLGNGDYWFLWDYSSLKINGNLNGTDIRWIRKLAGRSEDGAATTGKLTYLDLTDANIVAGGDYYYKPKSGTEYKTENNVASNYMFYFCNLKTLKFPSTITKIGENVCSHLPQPDGNENVEDNHIGTFTSIVIPSGVSEISHNAFAWNQNLTSIDIPYGVKKIGANIFYRCDALTTVNIPNSVEEMSCAFYFSKGLQYVHLPENSKYTKIVSSTFYGCQALKSLTIPSNITQIDWYAIQNSALIEFHFKSTNPPYMSTTMSGEYTFPVNSKIYVPKGSYNAYKTNSSFKNYTIIEE